jgi:hypothetical protein
LSPIPRVRGAETDPLDLVEPPGRRCGHFFLEQIVVGRFEATKRGALWLRRRILLLDPPGPAPRLLADVADFHFSDIAVRGNDGARAIGANDDAAAVEPSRNERRQSRGRGLLGPSRLELDKPVYRVDGANTPDRKRR